MSRLGTEGSGSSAVLGDVGDSCCGCFLEKLDGWSSGGEAGSALEKRDFPEPPDDRWDAVSIMLILCGLVSWYGRHEDCARSAVVDRQVTAELPKVPPSRIYRALVCCPSAADIAWQDVYEDALHEGEGMGKKKKKKESKRESPRSSHGNAPNVRQPDYLSRFRTGIADAGFGLGCRETSTKFEEAMSTCFFRLQDHSSARPTFDGFREMIRSIPTYLGATTVHSAAWKELSRGGEPMSDPTGFATATQKKCKMQKGAVGLPGYSTGAVRRFRPSDARGLALLRTS